MTWPAAICSKGGRIPLETFPTFMLGYASGKRMMKDQHNGENGFSIHPTQLEQDTLLSAPPNFYTRGVNVAAMQLLAVLVRSA
jgi:hypothetical protein